MMVTDTKTSFKKYIHAASNFMVFIPSRSIQQIMAKFLGLNSKGVFRSSGKEEESRCLVFTSSTKRENRKIYMVVVQ